MPPCLDDARCTKRVRPLHRHCPTHAHGVRAISTTSSSGAALRPFSSRGTKGAGMDSPPTGWPSRLGGGGWARLWALIERYDQSPATRLSPEQARTVVLALL